MGIQIKFTVDENNDGIQVKNFLRGDCDVSATLLRQLKLVENGITSNGVHIRTIDKLYSGDEVAITLPDEKNEIEPINLPIKILYEDEHIIAFDKSAFMTVHPVHGHIDDTLANAAAYYAESKGEVWSFRAVNRLDRDTSGVLLTAKNAYAAALLPKSVKKIYIAVCEGVIKEGGTVNAPIRLKEGHSIQREVGSGGVNAVTHYRPLKYGNGHTLTEFDLETGRTHQIRVHMSYLGYPLAGDDMYGGSLKYISRQALHCREVCFQHPVTKKQIRIESVLPEDILNILDNVEAEIL